MRNIRETQEKHWKHSGNIGNNKETLRKPEKH